MKKRKVIEAKAQRLGHRKKVRETMSSESQTHTHTHTPSLNEEPASECTNFWPRVELARGLMDRYKAPS